MTYSNSIAYGILKSVGTIVLICLSLYFLYQIQTVIIYLIVAVILAMIANPIVEFLKRRLKFSNTLAVITTLIIFLFLAFSLIMMFVPLITSESINLSLLDTKSIETRFLRLYSDLNQYGQNHHVDITKIVKENEITSKLNFSFFTDFFNSIIGAIGSFGIGLISVFFISFFLLKDKINFIEGIKQIIPDKHEEQILNSVEKTRLLLTRYFIGLLIQLTIICLLYLIILLVFGVKNAFVIAFLCALFNIIPYVGPLIAAVLASVLTMLSNLGCDFQTIILPTTIYVFIGFIIVHLLDSNISSPIIFSKSIKSHPLEIFLVILIAGILFGITAMIIAVPLYTILKVIGKEFFPENKLIIILTKNL